MKLVPSAIGRVDQRVRDHLQWLLMVSVEECDGRIVGRGGGWVGGTQKGVEASRKMVHRDGSIRAKVSAMRFVCVCTRREGREVRVMGGMEGESMEAKGRKVTSDSLGR